jgi:glutaconate CoA-transferase, subunit B
MSEAISPVDYTDIDQMVVAAARQIKDGDVIYLGTGLPVLAAFLAKHTHAPNCVVIFEVGTIRTSPCPLTSSVESLETQTRSDSLDGLAYVNFLAQRGAINFGFMGAGQIDRHGNVNDNAVGDYRKPIHRWLGAGGAPDVISFCDKTTIMIRQSKRRFLEKVDFVSCPGYLDGKPGQREEVGLRPNTGPVAVITQLGTYGFVDGEMVLKTYHGGVGVTIDQVRTEVGWDLKIATDVAPTIPPTEEELYYLREKVDPYHVFVGGKKVVLVEQGDQ